MNWLCIEMTHSRGKAGALVEFGNELMVVESTGGLIVDYML